MILTLDGAGVDTYHVDRVDSSAAFKEYIESHLEVRCTRSIEGSDLTVLCRDVSGADIGIGIINQHRNSEMFFVKGWNRTYQKLYEFLRLEHPAFPIDKKARRRRKLKKRFKLIFRIRHKLKKYGFKTTVSSVLRRVKRVFVRKTT